MNAGKFHYALLMVCGNALLAIASIWFYLPNKVVSGGLNGIGVIMEKMFEIEPVFLINVLLVISFIAGLIWLGKDFAMKTIASTILFPIFSQLFLRIPIVPLMPPIFASIIGGVLTGIGIGFVMRCGGSSGGLDIPPLILHKYTGCSVSLLLWIIDSIIVLLGFCAYGWLAVVIGLISVLCCGKALSYVLGYSNV